ncbi:MAG: nucleoside triphosphate pyrophosphohydrolase [Pyrinomonas sp.]|uniref:nucleoside triphosphate pyrophosphohydrolase n=1 Tax=Pyrinomonas sp. TaxID=2080306 RepID=UPI00331BEC65
MSPASFADLVQLMARLRSPQGCPWDREQTYGTLAPMLLEEAYEAFEAVEEAEKGRPLKLRDELGDLLFQIVFYAQVARERRDFTIEEVIAAIYDKMVRRHPHVFGDMQARDAAEVLRNWEAIKAEEKRARGDADESASILDGVPRKAPALMEAHQISVKAARVGFDWKNLDDVFAKLHEELEELREAIKSCAQQPSERVREEIGDVLFALVQIARHLDVEPETALKRTNQKFRQRFRHIEEELKRRERDLNQATVEEMEEIWQQAKSAEGPE